jgi:hypothetical protein
MVPLDRPDVIVAEILALSTISVVGLPHRSEAPQIDERHSSTQKTSIVAVKSPCHS